MFCHICGTQIADDAGFCHKCGTKVVYEDSADIQQKASDSKYEATIEDKFNVMLTKVGPDKLHMIKILKEWMGVGLKESQELVEQIPILLEKTVTLEEAVTIKTAFIKEGADVTFTDQEGHNVEITLHCKVCGAVLDEGNCSCRVCGNNHNFIPSCKVYFTQNGSVQLGNEIDEKESHDNGTKGKAGESFGSFMELPVFWRWFIGLAAFAGIGFIVWLLIIFLRWIFSSFILIMAAVAGGYIVYHKYVAEMITEFIYKKNSRKLQLPEEMSASTLLETLNGKFNYPYFKGVHYGKLGECIIEGKYSIYPVVFSKDNIAELDYISKENNKRKRTVLLEAMAIRDYINKFFNPTLPIDVVKDMKKLKLAEGQRKMVAIVSAAASILIVAAIVLDYISPGSLQSMVVPGIEVRSAYLSQYSKKVTIEEAFESYFEDGEWAKYDSEGYTNVVFTGTCIYSGEWVDVRVVFKLTGKNFIVDSLDINGRTQSDFILSALLSAVYEDY